MARAVKSNPMPAMAAALKPRMANAKNIVSSVPNAPARIVQATVTNVQDLNKVYDTIKTAMLGTGHEIIKEAVQTQVAETLATSGIPYAEDLMNLAGGRKSKPGAKGKQAKQSAAAGGSCSVPYDRNSFTGDTPVLLADGTRKPIATIAVGDVVQATDPTTDTSGPRKVTDVRSHESERLLYEITIATDTGNGTLTATDEHPFWVDNLNTWVTAEDLKPGYTFTTADNRPATVAGTRSFADARLVYNLTVDGLHTYYVGASSTVAVLTHNAEPWICSTEAPVYSDVDEQGRAGAAYALVTRQVLAAAKNDLIGSGPKKTLLPPGFISGKPPYNHSRGHLIGEQFGGSGRTLKNLVTQSQAQNGGPIGLAEAAIARHVADTGNPAIMSVTPLYKNGGNVSSHVLIEAVDDFGWNYMKELPNM